LNRAGQDILLLVGSDHGHETVEGVVPSNGFSANLYFSDDALERVAAVADFVASVAGIERVYEGEDLATLGHRTGTALRLAVTTVGSEDGNEFGIPGRRLAIADPLHSDTRMGCGQHGGLGRFEQSPFLIVHGDGPDV